MPFIESSQFIAKGFWSFESDASNTCIYYYNAANKMKIHFNFTKWFLSFGILFVLVLCQRLFDQTWAYFECVLWGKSFWKWWHFIPIDAFDDAQNEFWKGILNHLWAFSIEIVLIFICSSIKTDSTLIQKHNIIFHLVWLCLSLDFMNFCLCLFGIICS